MNAEIIDLEKWKKTHPPALVCLQHGLAMVIAWQALWLKMLYLSQKK